MPRLADAAPDLNFFNGNSRLAGCGSTVREKLGKEPDETVSVSEGTAASPGYLPSAVNYVMKRTL